MRTLMTCIIDTQAGNRAAKEGNIAKIVGQIAERLKPETAFFYTQNGHRSMNMIFDLKDSSEIPSIAEPLFQEFNAQVSFAPVMNLDDLKKGLPR